MKFQSEIIVAQTLPFVTKLFEDQDNNHLWQSTFISRQQDNFDLSKSVNYYQINGRMIEVFIRVVENSLPENYVTYATTPGLVQKVKHCFITDKSGETKWTVSSELTANGFVLKMIMLLFPKIFVKSIETYMQDFKIFAENLVD